jgi:hypothetical protein
MQTLRLCLGASLIAMASAGLALADEDVNAGQHSGDEAERAGRAEDLGSNSG